MPKDAIADASPAPVPAVPVGWADRDSDGPMQPLDFMLALLRDETASLADRKWAAERAAPYCHPRAAAKAPAEESDGGQEAALEALA